MATRRVHGPTTHPTGLPLQQHCHSHPHIAATDTDGCLDSAHSATPRLRPPWPRTNRRSPSSHVSLRRSDEREILMDNKTTRRGDSGPEERAETATRAACGLRHGKQMLAACWVSRGGYRGADLSHSAQQTWRHGASAFSRS